MRKTASYWLIITTLLALTTASFNPYRPVALGQSGDSCSFSSGPRIENDNLVFSISGSGDEPIVYIQSQNGPQMGGFPLQSSHSNFEELGGGSYRWDFSIPMSELESHFGNSVGDQSVYTSLDIDSYESCGSAVRIGSLSGAPEPEVPDLPEESVANVWYEAARANTESARDAGKCVEDSSAAAVQASESGNSQLANEHLAQAEDCRQTLQQNQQTIRNAQSYWQELKDGADERGETFMYQSYLDDINRWEGEVSGISSSSDESLTAAQSTLSEVADQQSESESGSGSGSVYSVNSIGDIPCAGMTGQELSTCQAEEECKGHANQTLCLSKQKCEENRDEGFTFTPSLPGEDGSAGGCYDLPSFLDTLVNYLLIFASIIAGFVFSIGAYKYLTSRGDPSATADARDMMIQAVIGVVLLAMAFVLIEFLSGAFGSGVTEDINLLRFGQ